MRQRGPRLRRRIWSQASALSLPALPDIYHLSGRASFFPNPENSFPNFSLRSRKRDAGPDMLSVRAFLIELLDCFRVGYLFAYTRKYPIPPKKPVVTVVASKLETYMKNLFGNIVRKSKTTMRSVT